MWCNKCLISLPMQKRRYVGGLIFSTGLCPQCNSKIILVEKEDERYKKGTQNIISKREIY